MLQRFIRFTGYVAVATTLYNIVYAVLYLCKMLYAWFTNQYIYFMNDFVKSLVGLGVGVFIAFISILADIKLEDRQRRKQNEESYSDYMSRNDSDSIG